MQAAPAAPSKPVKTGDRPVKREEESVIENSVDWSPVPSAVEAVEASAEADSARHVFSSVPRAKKRKRNIDSDEDLLMHQPYFNTSNDLSSPKNDSKSITAF